MPTLYGYTNPERYKAHFDPSDILRLYFNPTAYLMEDGNYCIFPFILLNTKERLGKPIGWFKQFDTRFLVYKYDGTYEDIQKEVEEYEKLPI